MKNALNDNSSPVSESSSQSTRPWRRWDDLRLLVRSSPGETPPAEVNDNKKIITESL